MPPDLHEHPNIDIVVCDDSIEDISNVTALITTYMSQRTIPYSLLVFENGQDLLDAMKGAESGFEIVLLDMMMEGLNGLSVAKHLQSFPIHSNVIFVSSNRDMALRGYEVAALRYIAKPVDYDLFTEAMDCAFDRLKILNDIAFPTLFGEERVPVSDVVYIEPSNRRAKVVCLDRILEITLTFAQAVEHLKDLPFALSHRTVLVNLAHVQTVL
ncbi:MAG: DNA-binding response regulator, partial [Eubacteriales bacterium]